MVEVGGRWKETGDIYIPESSSVTDEKHWRTMGALLALALLAGENLHPISPAVVYALLSNVHPRPRATAQMHLSLSLLHQFDAPKANMLIPWMIIPPGQDWRSLPDGHRNILRDVVTNLNIDVSGMTLVICRQ